MLLGIDVKLTLRVSGSVSVLTAQRSLPQVVVVDAAEPLLSFNSEAALALLTVFAPAALLFCGDGPLIPRAT